MRIGENNESNADNIIKPYRNAAAGGGEMKKSGVMKWRKPEMAKMKKWHQWLAAKYRL